MTAITMGDVTAEVHHLGRQEVVAAITSSSVQRLSLEEGDHVSAVIEAAGVMIGKQAAAGSGFEPL